MYRICTFFFLFCTSTTYTILFFFKYFLIFFCLFKNREFLFLSYKIILRIQKYFVVVSFQRIFCIRNYNGGEQIKVLLIKLKILKPNKLTE